MRFFLAFALIATVASAAIKPTQITGELAEIAEIVSAIQSPSTDPATAVALEALLLDVLGLQPTPVVVGAPIIDTTPVVGPAIIDFPLPDGGAVTAVEPTPVVVAAPIQPSPVVVGEIPAGSSPLVQIIVNVNQQEAAGIVPAPVEAPVAEEVYVPGPVNVVDGADLVIEPVAVVNPVLPGPVNVVDGADSAVVEPVVIVSPVAPGPVNVVEGVDTPVVEPVIVGTPIIPAPAVVLPDELN